MHQSIPPNSCWESAAAESLEHLTLQHPALGRGFFVGLARYQKLRVLTIRYCPQLTNERMVKLDLQELTEFILRGQSLVTMDGLIGMVQNCRKIESMTLSFTGHEIDPVIYDKLVTICREQNKKLTIIVETDRKPSRRINFYPDFIKIIFKIIPINKKTKIVSSSSSFFLYGK